MSKKEKAFITSEINTYYSKRYEGKTTAIYYSAEYSKEYKFEIYGYNNYKFIKTKKIK